jgi:hypothetical protein
MAKPHFDPEYVFSHHQPTAEKLQHYEAIHAAAQRFAEVILANTPAGEDQSAALRWLRQAMMMANAAVALDGKFSE